jgi:DNA-binding FrmR family transcriptional regulator
MRDEAKREVLGRLRTIEGHVSGLARMVDEGAYCIDVINQVTAVQRSLDRVATAVLDNHLQTCVRQAMSGDGASDQPERERIIHELLRVYEMAMSR